MKLIGGQFADTQILFNNVYYIAVNNRIRVYSQTFQLLVEVQPTAHTIKKIAFRNHSATQIFILISKRMMLYDLETRQTVSVIEPEDKEAQLVDFVQHNEELFIAVQMKKTNILVKTKIAPQASQFDLRDPVLLLQQQQKIKHLLYLREHNSLAVTYQNNLMVMHLGNGHRQTTTFKDHISAIEYDKHLIIGFNNGIMLYMNTLPLDGYFNSQNNQCLTLDKHFDGVRSIQYDHKNQQLISCQYNSNQIGVWTYRDQNFVWTPYSTKQYIPTRLQIIGQLFFVLTTQNTIMIYDMEFQPVHSIIMLPQSKDIETLSLQAHGGLVYYQTQYGNIFCTNTKLTQASLINHSNRELYKTANSGTREIQIIDYDVRNDYIASLNEYNDQQLIVSKNSIVLYNLYNVISEGFRVRFLSDDVLLLFSHYGFKIFRLAGGAIYYSGFVKVANLVDAQCATNGKVYCLTGTGVYVYHIGCHSQELDEVEIVPLDDQQCTIDGGRVLLVNYFEDIVVIRDNDVVLLSHGKEHATLLPHGRETGVQFTVSGDAADIYIFCAGVMYKLTNKKLVELFSPELKQPILRFTITDQNWFVFFFQELKSGYFLVCDEKGADVEEQDSGDLFSAKDGASRSISTFLLEKDKNDDDHEQINTIPRLKFKSNLPSSQLAPGREIFNSFIE